VALARRATDPAGWAAGAGVIPVSSETGRTSGTLRPTGMAGTSAMVDLNRTAGTKLVAGWIMIRGCRESGGASRTGPPGGITGTSQAARLARTIGHVPIAAPHEEARPIVTPAASRDHGRPMFGPRERRDRLPTDTHSARKAN